MGISQRPGGYFYNAASALVKGSSLNLIPMEAGAVEPGLARSPLTYTSLHNRMARLAHTQAASPHAHRFYCPLSPPPLTSLFD